MICTLREDEDGLFGFISHMITKPEMKNQNKQIKIFVLKSNHFKSSLTYCNYTNSRNQCITLTAEYFTFNHVNQI